MRYALILVMLAFAGSAVAADEDLQLKGKIGIGFDSIPGASATTGFLPGVNQPNAIVGRYWLSEKLSWELQLAGSFNSQPNPVSGTATNGGLGLGTMVKFNFARPTPNVLAQFMAGLSVAGLSQNSGGTGPGQSTTTVGLMVGTGFEAFMPFWRSLSLEGNVGLHVTSVQTKSDAASQAAQASSTVGISGDGFSPLNVALHYYF